MFRPSPFTRYLHPALFRFPSSRLTRQPLSACCSSSRFFVVRTDQQVLQQVLDDAIRQAQQGPLNSSQYARPLTAVTKASSVDSRFSLPNPKHQLFLRHQVTFLDAKRFASFARQYLQAKVLHSLAKLRLSHNLDLNILPMVQRELLPVLRDTSAFKSYDAKEFALMVWALAKLGVSDKLVFAPWLRRECEKTWTTLIHKRWPTRCGRLRRPTCYMADAGLFVCAVGVGNHTTAQPARLKATRCGQHGVGVCDGTWRMRICLRGWRRKSRNTFL